MAGAVLVAALTGPVAAVDPAAAAEPEDRPITAAVARLDFEAIAPTPSTAAASPTQPSRYQPEPQRSRKARVGRAIAGAAVGAVGGAFAGGYLGAAIDGDCGGCDDPGFKGFLIGFPTGGVVGGILGGMFLFR
jgi:hypothetical protein